MPLPVSLDAVADELDAQLDEMTVFINRKTGEIVSVSDDDAALVEEETTEDDLLDWQAEMLPRLHSILLGEDWVALPSKFDINEWDIMKMFADSFDSELISTRLQRAIRGKGAFRMFRAAVEEAELVDRWYDFKHGRLREVAREALKDLGIPHQ